jgi:sugar lactone lactonase YvrE
MAAALLLAGTAGAQSDYLTPYAISTPVGITAGANSDDGRDLNRPAGVAVDAAGNLYVADTGNDMVRKFSTSGFLSEFAGTFQVPGTADGTGTAAQFNAPQGIAVDADGNVYVADTGNDTIRKITPSGIVTTLAGASGVAGSTDGPAAAARFNSPVGVALDAGGNIYVADETNDTIRKITPSGIVSTLAGTPGSKGSADGTGASAQFDRPSGVAVDSSGNIYVADATNETIRKVTPSGAVTTLAGTPGAAASTDGTGAAARFFFPVGVAVDAGGNVFVAEEFGETIREVTPSGMVTTLAGVPDETGMTDGTGAAALFNNPLGIAIDAGGNLFIADSDNISIRKGSFDGTPQILTQPADRLVTAGAGATFQVVASGSPPLAYQWALNGSAIAGATGSSYVIASAGPSNAGSYTVTVTSPAGSVTSAAATLTVNSGSSTARLVNISTRAQVGTGGNILIPGFVISGSGVETLLIRADGPALAQFGLTGLLAQPTLSLLDASGKTVASNTGWATSPDPSQLASVAASVGAFALSAGSNDCALVANLPAGAYTVQVMGTNNTTGVALAEIYEVSSTGTRLANISTRAQVGTGANIIIPGFVISGSGSEQLLVRADGPALAQFGVTGILAQPSLSVFDSADSLVASNTVWGTSTSPSLLASIASSVGAFALAAGSADSAQVVNLPAGAYTVQVAGANGTTGVALAEIYESP